MAQEEEKRAKDPATLAYAESAVGLSGLVKLCLRSHQSIVLPQEKRRTTMAVRLSMHV
jgi:hypothetical protein